MDLAARFIPVTLAPALAIAACGLNSTSGQTLPSAPPGVQTASLGGVEFSLVSGAGNAPHLHGEPGSAGHQRGAVGYDFWMARTETTAAQFAAFVNAYAPHWPGLVTDWSLSGRFVGRGTDGVWRPIDGFDLSPARPSLPVAMRFCNWLTNGAPVSAPASAFEQGAYDLVGLSPTAPASAYVGASPQPGAVYRLPTVDEWIKAMYFDPNRHGPGAPGYWDYPIGSDTAPVSGYPELGGQTSAGGAVEFEAARSFPVAWYPGVQSPWGMFDGSGSSTEFLSTPIEDLSGFLAAGTPIFGHTLFDHIDLTLSSVSGSGWAGIRLVYVPSPGGAAVLALACLAPVRRRTKSQ